MRNRVPLAVLLYVFAANVPLWIAARSLGLMVHGWFSIEFLVIGLLSVFLRPVVTATLLFLAIVAGVLQSVSRTYMLEMGEMARSSSSMLAFAPSHRWSIAAILLSGVAVSVAAVFVYRGTKLSAAQFAAQFAWVLAAFVVLSLGVDLSRGQMPLVHPDRKVGSVRLLHSPLASLVAEERKHCIEERWARSTSASRLEGASLVLAGMEREASSPDGLRSNMSLTSSRPDIVLVLVESWGQPLSAAMLASIERPYGDAGVAARYTVSRGAVPFRGPTVGGETRELCGTTLGLGVMTASSSRLDGCLPARMRRMGYHTTAVHGFSGRMFARSDWYRKAQFDELWFREQLDGAGLPRCEGPLPGTCDAAVAEWIGDRLEKNGDAPQFLYWVTLGSHLPVPVPNGVKDAPPCLNIGEDEGTPLCSWYQLVGNVHRSVARLAARVSRPTVFVVVGDHAPPFSDADTRSRFSAEMVPYVVLEPLTPGEEPQYQRPGTPVLLAAHPTVRNSVQAR